MNRLVQRILAAPVAVRRATGVALLLTVVAGGFGLPATAQSTGPQPFAGSSECASADETRTTDDSGRALFHGATHGIQLAADPTGSSGGATYVGDVFLLRRVPPASAEILHGTAFGADLIRGVAVAGQQVFWTDTAAGRVRIRTLFAAGVVDLASGPAVDETTRLQEHGIAVGSDNTIYFSSPANNQIYKVGPNGPAPVSHGALSSPSSLAALEEDGRTVLYVGGKSSRVMRVDPATGATTPVGAALNVALIPTARVAVDPVDKQLFVADAGGVAQIDLPNDPDKATRIVSLVGGNITSLAVGRTSPSAPPVLAFANQGVPTDGFTTAPTRNPGDPVVTIVARRCDIQSIRPNEPVRTSTTASPTTLTPTTATTLPDSAPPSSIPPLTVRTGDPAPTQTPDTGTATDPEQLLGTRAEGDFGQFNPFVGNSASSNADFTPFLGSGGQSLGGFAPSGAAIDPFSGGGVPSLTAPGSLETTAAAAGPPPPASVANPGPVGAAPPPPAGAPLPAGSPAPVQGWPGAPAEPAQGATRYAMTAAEDRDGPGPLLYGLLGLGACCLLFAAGAGTRRGGGAAATAAGAGTRPARAWAIGR